MKLDGVWSYLVQCKRLISLKLRGKRFLGATIALLIKVILGRGTCFIKAVCFAQFRIESTTSTTSSTSPVDLFSFITRIS